MKKKVLSLMLVAVMLIFQLALPAAANDYNTGALDNAYAELKKLNTPANRIKAYDIIGAALEAIKEHEQTDVLTAEDLYDIVKEKCNDYSDTWDAIINEEPETSEDKIEKSSVLLLLGKLIEREDNFKAYYSTANDIYSGLANFLPGLDAEIKSNLGFGTTEVSNGAVYAAMLLSIGQVITLEDGIFVLRENSSPLENMIKKMISDSDDAELVADFITGYYSEDIINEKIQGYLDTINRKIELYELTQSNILNIIDALKAFNLYYTVPSGGDGGYTPPPPAPPILNEESTVSDTINYLDEKIKGIESAATVEAAIKIAQEAIEEAKDVLGSVLLNFDVIKSLTQLVNRVLDKVNTQTITPTVTGANAKAVISTTAATDLLKIMDTIVSTANTLQANHDAINADIKVEKVLKISVASTDKSVTSVDVDIPSNIFTATKEKGIDKIAIDTGIATITLAPDAINLNDAGNVTFNASIVDKTQLPASVLERIGDKPVYDFNLLVGDTKVSTFEKPISISVPYTLKEGEDPDKITVFYINDDGELENVIGKYDADTGMVTFTTSHFSGYFVDYNDVTFSDLTATEWARKEIESMAAKGIIQGVGNNNYAPQSTLTRAQFATMIVNAFKLEDTAAQNVFTDVKDTDWFYSAVLSAYASGIINGTTTTTFSPNSYISRQDMAVMISRALVLLINANTDRDRSSSIADFTDKNLISDYAVKGFEMTASYGIMIGNAKGMLNPKGNATRAEAAIVLYRLFNIVY